MNKDVVILHLQLSYCSIETKNLLLTTTKIYADLDRMCLLYMLCDPGRV